MSCNHIFELSAVTHIMPRADALRKVGNVGLLQPNLEARLVDDDENDVKPGERGELWIRGPNIMKFVVHSHYLVAVNNKDDLEGTCTTRKRPKTLLHPIDGLRLAISLFGILKASSEYQPKYSTEELCSF